MRGAAILGTAACLAAALSSAAAGPGPGGETAPGTAPLHRKLLVHDSTWFRGEPKGGGYNALPVPGGDVADQVTATTCLPQDDFVRVSVGSGT
jgi:hypothetical protein